MQPFRKRTYQSFGEFLADIRFLLGNLRRLRSIMKGRGLEPRFRERMMLAVTRVNECRFCAHAHTKFALREGLTRDEIAALLGGDLGGCPEGEIEAVLYARHWAEANARPDAAARAKLAALYGAGQADNIELALRVIRAGNLTGNTVDAFLHRISGGRWGK